MIISIASASGTTGSTLPRRYTVYLAEQPFTTDDLPEPFNVLTGTYSQFGIKLPEPDKLYWVMFSVEDLLGNIIWYPIQALADLSTDRTKVLTSPMITVGDYTLGYFPGNIATAYRFELGDFERGRPDPLAFVEVSFNWMFVDNTYIRVMPNSYVGEFTFRELYLKGYLAVSGDMSDVLPPAMITALGGPVEQGVHVDKGDIRWTASVLSESEHLRILCSVRSVAFATGHKKMIGNARPISETRDVMTTTVSSTDPTKIVGYSPYGPSDYDIDTPLTVYLYIHSSPIDPE